LRCSLFWDVLLENQSLAQTISAGHPGQLAFAREKPAARTGSVLD
jgi:hypothetical protein